MVLRKLASKISILVGILELKKNSTPSYRLYANGSPQGLLLNRVTGIAGIIVGVEI